jgi:hypothetical protein
MTTDLLAGFPDLAHMEREAQALERKAHALRQIIDGVKTLNGSATQLLLARAVTPPPAQSPIFVPGSVLADTPVGSTHPRGREAVRMIVGDLHGPWPASHVKKEFERRGWSSSWKAIDTTLQRMTQDGEIIRVRKGVYTNGPTGGAEQAAGTSTPEAIGSGAL